MVGDRLLAALFFWAAAFLKQWSLCTALVARESILIGYPLDGQNSAVYGHSWSCLVPKHSSSTPIISQPVKFTPKAVVCLVHW